MITTNSQIADYLNRFADSNMPLPEAKKWLRLAAQRLEARGKVTEAKVERAAKAVGRMRNGAFSYNDREIAFAALTAALNGEEG